MTIDVVQLPEQKVWRDAYKQYTMTYPLGFPVHVRRIWNCSQCGVEVGGFFGNKVYGDAKLGLCQDCQDKNDPIVQMCIAQTGMTPRDYQKRHKAAWNE
jgi:hypothetical protein